MSLGMKALFLHEIWHSNSPSLQQLKVNRCYSFRIRGSDLWYCKRVIRLVFEMNNNIVSRVREYA